MPENVKVIKIDSALEGTRTENDIVLPAVQKANTCGQIDLNDGEPLIRRCDVERERSCWEEREKNLKQKIKEFFVQQEKQDKIAREWAEEDWTGEMEEFYRVEFEKTFKLQKELLSLAQE